MAKPQVLFLGDLDREIPEYKEFESKFECVHYHPTTKQQVIHDLNTKFSEIGAIYGAWEGLIGIGGLRNELVDALPASLKVVVTCSVGYDHYDAKQLADKGIIFCNVPSLGAEQVADLALYFSLNSFRYFQLFEKSFQETNHTLKTRAELESNNFDSETGKVVKGPDNHFSFGHQFGNRLVETPYGKHAVIVGFGAIGKAVARRLSSLGLVIHYVKRTKLTPEEEAELPFQVTFHDSLEDARDVADLVVLCLPGTPETNHMINKDLIDKFAKPIRIVNVGRGTIVDEQAVVDGLKSGKVIFLGSDVYEKEPVCHPELLTRDDVVLTPHIGSSTHANYDATAIFSLRNITNVLLDGGIGFSKVN